MSDVLILRHLKVEGANAIAGQTWGFPAISNFLGFVHALSRKAEPELGLTLEGCGVICHSHQPLSYKTESWGDQTFSLTRNPHFTRKQATKFVKEGTPPPFVEEGRMLMDVSLVIPVEGRIRSGDDHRRELAAQLSLWVQMQRLAGGTIRELGSVELQTIPDDEAEASRTTRKLLRSLLPGFALVSRAETLTDHLSDLRQSNPQTEAIDAWLDFAALKYQAEQPEEETAADVPVAWQRIPKPASGWIVPITIGYRGISELHEPGTVTRTRDGKTAFRFVESVYSIGQWLSPHRVTLLDDLVWHYDADPDAGWYLCTNNWQPPLEDSDSPFIHSPA
ncbi:MAG: CRISPR-associated protein Csy2 [Motiliproteus sp.]|jgi:CRISPR-associated protein Csy2